MIRAAAYEGREGGGRAVTQTPRRLWWLGGLALASHNYESSIYASTASPSPASSCFESAFFTSSSRKL